MLRPAHRFAALRTPLTRACRRFEHDARGVSAVEFAILTPVMLLIFFGTAQLCIAIITQRRVSHSNAAIGDMVADYGLPAYNSNGVATAAGQAMTPTLMTDIFLAANLIIAPYPTAPFQIRVTSIVVDSAGRPRVNWSCTPSGQASLAPLTAESIVTPPAGLISTAAGDSLIMSETLYPYTSSINYVPLPPMNFNNTFYFKPRATNSGVGFYTGTSPTWSAVWDASSVAQSISYSGAATTTNCSYQSG